MDGHSLFIHVNDTLIGYGHSVCILPKIADNCQRSFECFLSVCTPVLPIATVNKIAKGNRVLIFPFITIKVEKSFRIILLQVVRDCTTASDSDKPSCEVP